MNTLVLTLHVILQIILVRKTAACELNLFFLLLHILTELDKNMKLLISGHKDV